MLRACKITANQCDHNDQSRDIIECLEKACIISTSIFMLRVYKITTSQRDRYDQCDRHDQCDRDDQCDRNDQCDRSDQFDRNDQCDRSDQCNRNDQFDLVECLGKACSSSSSSSTSIFMLRACRTLPMLRFGHILVVDAAQHL